MFGKKGRADLFFNAKKIAIVGASREEYKVGHTIFKNLLLSEEIEVFPVNPNADEVLGKRVYKELSEIPHDIDCVVIAVKAELVPKILLEAGMKKVKCAIIISAGFSEAGNFELENQIKEIAEEAEIALLGPNVFGIIDPYKNLNTTFFEGIPERGDVAFLSQSGALGVAVSDWALKEGFGFSGFVSLGNSVDLDFSDFIEYYGRDVNTRVITLYVESLKSGKGKKFIEVCKRVSKIKPIIAIKGGKSVEGEKAASSHTAAMASEEGVYEGIFKQAGIIEVNGMRELFDTADAFTKIEKLGKKVCIVTNAGGPGVLCTDACSKNGVSIPELPDAVKAELDEILLPGWSHNNPVDMLGGALAEDYGKVLKILDKEDFFDFFVVLLTPQYMTQPLETAEILTKLRKPVIAGFIGGEKIEEAVKYLKKKVPVFSDVRDIGVVVGKIVG